MIVVTGGAGFVGSNLLRALNVRGRDDIILVDDLSDGRKFANVADCRIGDYLDKDACLDLVVSGAGFGADVECVYHLGANTDTTDWNGRRMMHDNFTFPRALFEFCRARDIPFVYASSAAVYGASTRFEEIPANERPLNVYGYSKLAFDQYVRRRLPATRSLVVGLRYFNVYGPREQHKGRMASVAWHFNEQMRAARRIRLFDGSHGRGAGEQRRDFVHVEDVVDVTLWCAGQTPRISGIYNCGTGRAETFNTLARAIIECYGEGDLEYIAFPPELVAAYQAYTQADLTRLRGAGYAGRFRAVADGVREYLNWLNC